MNEFRALELRFLAAETTLFPFELAFVIIAKLQVLHRMQRVASSKSVSARTWIVINRLFLAAVVACLLIGTLGNFVAAVSFAQAADLNAEAAAAWSLNDTLAGSSLEQRARAAVSQGVRTASVRPPLVTQCLCNNDLACFPHSVYVTTKLPQRSIHNTLYRSIALPKLPCSLSSSLPSSPLAPVVQPSYKLLCNPFVSRRSRWYDKTKRRSSIDFVS